MRMLWTWRDIGAPVDVVWELLVDPERWPEWGPTVRNATIDGAGRLAAGATGTVTTVVGIDLPFEITEWDPGRTWSWRVAGIAATSHAVEPTGANTCRAGFGVAWPAAAYLGVCALALRRIDAMAVTES